MITIIQQESFITKEICDRIINNYRKNHFPKLIRWYHHFDLELKSIIDEYIIGKFHKFINNKKFFEKYENFELMIVVMIPGMDFQSYGKHYDNTKRLNIDVLNDKKFIEIYGNSYPLSYREFTSIYYLNDNFKGGRLYLPQHKLLIKPTTGKMVCFPGNKNHIHKVLPITEGIRFSISLWYGRSIKE